MTPAPPPEQSVPNLIRSSNLLFWWLAPILLLLFALAIWSNHFADQFHADDFATVVNNRALDSLSNIPGFFAHPRLASSEPEGADYRPVLTSAFAIDKSISRSNSPAVYQMDTFFWFGVLIFATYLVFRLIPGTHPAVALFAAALFGLHPITAETVNYISRRGSLLAATGVSLAMALWLIWPRRLPKKLGLDLNRVPQNWWQDQIRSHGLTWERTYKAFIKLPIPFYLIPLVPALFADPSTAVFAALLLVYIRLFDSNAGYKRLIVPAILCGAYWIAQTALILKVSPFLRIPLFTYWKSQPLVALRYVLRFFLPETINADSGFQSVSLVGAIAGVLGLAALVACAVLAGRREKWRGVAFGLWWFLVALAPSMLVPQRTLEANHRMFLAAAGLAFAVAHIAGILVERLFTLHLTPALRVTAIGVTAFLTVTVLVLLGWMTHERNSVWENEKSLWSDVITKSPDNGRGYLMYSAALAADGDDVESQKALLKAVPLCAEDGLLQLGLAEAFDRLNKDVDAEFHFRRALLLSPGSTAYARFGAWLFNHQRLQEALDMSRKALSLNPDDVISRHTLMDLFARQSDWVTVAKLAKETLSINPGDDTGKRSLTVATASIDQVRQAEEDVKTTPTVDDYLKLSVLYFQGQRFEDCAKAAREALRLRPNLAEAYANLAAAMHSLGRDEEAIAALREVIRLRPDMAFAKTDLEILLDKKASQPAPNPPN